MEPMISRSLPSLVKKTCTTTKGKGKRREPSSLPHIRGARLLPSTGSPFLQSSIRPVLSSPNGTCVCMRACIRVRGRTRSCLGLVLKGVCVGDVRARARAYVRACVRACVHACVHTRVRSRVSIRIRVCVCVLARGTGICSPRFFFFFSLSILAVLSISLRRSFSLSKRRRVRERYRAVRFSLDIPMWINKRQANARRFK